MPLCRRGLLRPLCAGSLPACRQVRWGGAAVIEASGDGGVRSFPTQDRSAGILDSGFSRGAGARGLPLLGPAVLWD
ncbi:hypothetical protein NDU88_002802 [Pleurodeles waltl]|uniref:Uncharacterized protein n=1 Tax=Pleurodeles waltl TaxID=8319 RepID=A0AAV7SF35_PLEWA|nr:hypothetical protein NDU88_002801 [Pleurodeles waltl]KAJ1162334.1 hypothetical protein NDU88_002802 [Pleurodeles waltl]